MGYAVLGERDAKWQPRRGLEGPFFFATGRVLYYDTKEGEYWDPPTVLTTSSMMVGVVGKLPVLRPRPNEGIALTYGTTIFPKLIIAFVIDMLYCWILPAASLNWTFNVF
jgi:hypothetical protein